MYMIIPYSKGTLFDNIKVQTLVVYATIAYATTKVFVVGSFRYGQKPAKNPRQKPPKNPWQKPAKNPMRQKSVWNSQKLL